MPTQTLLHAVSHDEARHIEGYAAALQDVLRALTGSNDCSKSYDPLTICGDGNTLHSYAFNMKDGGRHHPVSDYADVDEIKKTLLDEVVNDIQASFP